MSSTSDLLITINADAKGVTSAYQDIQKQTEDLESSLSDIAKVSGVAFAALSAQVAVSLKAFSDSDQAAKALTLSLQNQGIYTDDLAASYKEYAEQVSATTGFSQTQITAAQAVAQTYLGQVPITKQLTKSIADLAQAQGISLPQAAEELGKAIGNGTGMLLRQGLQFATTDTEADRYQKTLDFVTTKYGGMADAANTGLGSLRGLQSAFEESEVELGQRFAPAATAVIKALTEFFSVSKDGSDTLVDLKAGLIAVGLVISGVLVVLPLAAQGFLAVRAAMIALEVGAGPLGWILLAVTALGVGIAELAIHWQTASQVIVNVVKGLVQFVSDSFGALGTVILGAFTLNPAKITEGLKAIQTAFATGINTAMQSIPQETQKALTQQDAIKKQFADKAQAQRNADEQARIALQKAENDAILLQINEGSDAQIALKKKEIDTLKALTTAKNDSEKVLLRQNLADIRDEESTQQAEDLQRDKDFQATELAADKDFLNKKQSQDFEYDQKEINKIKATQLTEQEANKKVYMDGLKAQVAAHNTFLEEQIKYGTAYAAIDEAMHSAVFQGTQSAIGDLAQLQNSSNAELKAIGKAASIAQIAIKTAESAMNIFAGFSTIPFVGPELGLVAAAAAIAYGAEQIGNVAAAQTGGVVGGTGFGDSQPYLLEPGELIAPRQNFDEVVNSVAQSRGLGSQEQGEGGGYATVMLQLKGDLMDFVEAKLIQRKFLNISLQGSR